MTEKVDFEWTGHNFEVYKSTLEVVLKECIVDGVEGRFSIKFGFEDKEQFYTFVSGLLR